LTCRAGISNRATSILLTSTSHYLCLHFAAEMQTVRNTFVMVSVSKITLGTDTSRNRMRSGLREFYTCRESRSKPKIVEFWCPT